MAADSAELRQLFVITAITVKATVRARFAKTASMPTN